VKVMGVCAEEHFRRHANVPTGDESNFEAVTFQKVSEELSMVAVELAALWCIQA
jgi:hypothetical protein